MTLPARKSSAIKAPFPYFGGKSRAAELIWRRVGDVENYVEPFAGSLAVLLARPHEAGLETVNDIDANISNFWRAVQSDPEAVASHADWPVNESDLEARHFWLVSEGQARLRQIMTGPDGYDPKIAGWWVWGQCAWIGSGWCSGEGPWRVGENGWGLRNAGQGINRQLPHLGNAGQGINRKLPHLRNAGKGILDYLLQLCDRLRKVRVACGDWTRVLTPSITFRHGLTGILLDPPYGDGELDYAAGGNRCGAIAQDVRAWAIENGRNPDLRIALCSYGDAGCPDGWTQENWTAAGGYSSTAAGDTQGKKNRHKETIYFSPACVPVNQPTLWGALA